MAQIDDFTVVKEWDLAAAVLQDLVKSVAFAETDDFTSVIMRTGDVEVAGQDVLENIQNMEQRLLHEETPTTSNAFFSDLKSLFAAFQTWYVSGENGTFSSVPAALADKHYRIGYNLKDAWAATQGGTIGSAYLCLTKNIELARAFRGNAPTYPNTLPSDVTYVPLVVEVVGGAIGAVNLTVAFVATYSDDTTATETTLVTALGADGTRWLATRQRVGSQPITGDGCNTGDTIIPMTTTTGMVAGQKVLVRDETWPVSLTVDCLAAAIFTCEDTLPFQAGDAVTLHDDNTADENATVLIVNHETKTITLTAATAGNFTVAQNAHMRLQTAEDYGWTEVVEIASVQAGVSITVDSALKHTYSSDGYAQRLIKSIASVVLTNGTGGDGIRILALPDRPTFEERNSSSSSSSSQSYSSSSSSSESSSSSSSSSSSESSSSSSSSSESSSSSSSSSESSSSSSSSSSMSSSSSSSSTGA